MQVFRAYAELIEAVHGLLATQARLREEAALARQRLDLDAAVRLKDKESETLRATLAGLRAGLVAEGRSEADKAKIAAALDRAASGLEPGTLPAPAASSPDVEAHRRALAELRHSQDQAAALRARIEAIDAAIASAQRSQPAAPVANRRRIDKHLE